MLLASVLSSGSIVVAGQLGYVANGDGSVSVFDTDTDRVVKTIPIQINTTFPLVSLLLSPRARLLFVLANAVTSDATLVAIDTTVHRVISPAGLVAPVSPGSLSLLDIALSRDGTRLYVKPVAGLSTSETATAVFSTFDAGELRQLSAVSVPVPASAPLPTLAPGRGRIYAVNEGGGLAVVDAATGGQVTEIALPPLSPASSSPIPIKSPGLLSPDESSLVVGDAVVDLQSNQVVGRLPASFSPVRFSADGRTLFGLIGTSGPSAPGPRAARCRHGILPVDETIVALDLASLQIIARVPLGPTDGSSTIPFGVASPDGRRVGVIITPLLDGCTAARSPELAVADVGEGTVVGTVPLKAPFPTFIAQSPAGGRVILAETRFVARGRRSVSDLLDVDLGAGVGRHIDVGSFVTSSSFLQTLTPGRPVEPSGAFTPDGGKLYLIGNDGVFSGTEVRVLTGSEERLVPLAGGRFGAQQVKLGDPCTSPDGCFCRSDVDCDDANPCTVDTCEGAQGCKNEPLGCFAGVQCLFVDQRTTECLGSAQQRRLVRTRRDVDAAASALRRGDEEGARGLLDGAEREVKRLLAAAIKGTNAPIALPGVGGPTPGALATRTCYTLVFPQQLKLLRSIRGVRSRLGTCKSETQ